MVMIYTNLSVDKQVDIRAFINAEVYVLINLSLFLSHLIQRKREKERELDFESKYKFSVGKFRDLSSAS